MYVDYKYGTEDIQLLCPCELNKNVGITVSSTLSSIQFHKQFMTCMSCMLQFQLKSYYFCQCCTGVGMCESSTMATRGYSTISNGYNSTTEPNNAQKCLQSMVWRERHYTWFLTKANVTLKNKIKTHLANQ